MRGLWGSLRGRFALVAGAGVAALALAAAYGTWRVVDTTWRSRVVAAEQARVELAVTDFVRSVHEAELPLHRHVTFLGREDRVAAEAALARARERARRLAAEEFARRDPVLRDVVGAMLAAFERMDAAMAEVLRRLERVETRFPGIPVLLDELYPLNQAFLAAVNGALAEAREADEAEGGAHREVVQLLEELRYAWAQQVSLVRLYIANRSGVFGDPDRSMANNLRDRALFLEQVHKALQRLDALRRAGRLPLAVEAAVEEMLDLVRRYEATFAKVAAIYRSEGWRAEIPILRERLVPAQRDFWDAVARLQRRLAALARERIEHSRRAAEILASILWLFALGAGGLLVAVYAAFGRLVHGPLVTLARAMEREGAGEAAAPLPEPGVEEVRGLVRAFERMRQQIRARERRLQAILDNAAEGVITLDSEGRIQGFNRAAERLFGYAAGEVLGRDVMMLVPEEDRERYRRWVRRLARQREQRPPRPMTGTGLRRDGSRFALEANVSVLDVEGRRLITAIVSDVSEREAMMSHLRELAERDALTGLYNRHYLMQELERAVERARRGQGPRCGLLYIDLDNFKFVNDTLGHLAGDRVLQEVTELLRRRVRGGDLLARLGGDEFAVVLYDVDEDAALAAAEGYRHQLAGYTVRHEGTVIDVGCSIGVAVLTPDVASKEDLLARADLAVHLAKRAGRNRVHLFRPEDRGNIEAMSADIGWVRRIRRAIAEDRFVLALQPVVRCEDRVVHSYEVLVRMRDEDGELVHPGGFLPSAERFGLMADIDRWVLRRALRILASQRRGRACPRYAVNLSAQSVGDPTLLRFITHVLEDTGVDPSCVTFEITETVAITSMARAKALLEGLRALGCGTALDDFGVGYSSFAYLKDLPVDQVKIDGSFVRGLEHDRLKQAMVRAMNEVAHALGKETVAECVETEAALAMLREIGVDYAQGFLVGRPGRAREGVVPLAVVPGGEPAAPS